MTACAREGSSAYTRPDLPRYIKLLVNNPNSCIPKSSKPCMQFASQFSRHCRTTQARLHGALGNGCRIDSSDLGYRWHREVKVSLGDWAQRGRVGTQGSGQLLRALLSLHVYWSPVWGRSLKKQASPPRCLPADTCLDDAFLGMNL